VTIDVAVMRFSAANDEAATDPLLSALPSLIVQDIARLRHATVKSFGTSSQVDTRSTSAQAAGTTLGVRHLMTGTVSKDGDSYEIGLRLIEASTQTVLMNRRFKTTAGGINQLRAEIVFALIQEIELDDEPGIQPLPSGIPSAVLAYLDARTLVDRDDIASLDSARARMTALADTEGDFPAARAIRAEAIARLVRFGVLAESSLPQAWGLTQEAVKDEPTRPEIQRAAGVVALASRRYAAALAAADRSLALDPFQPECHRLRAEVLLISGDLSAATAELAKAASMDPQHSRTLFLRGLMAHRGGDNPTAAKYYEQAIAAGGNSASITSSFLASAWLRGTRPSSLVEYYRTRASASPEDFRLQYLLGRAFAEQLDSAQVHFETGLRLTKDVLDRDPSNVSALLTQALLLARLGKFTEAETSLSVVMRSEELTATSWYRIANVYTLIQKKDDALKALKIAVERRFDLAEALNPDFGSVMDEPDFRAFFVRPLTETQP
jgi:tetratricopeptide (TPR) repeat protein/TolB-like protein